MRDKKLSVVFLGVIAVIAVGIVFKIASSVIMPMVIALLFSFILYPLIMAMEKIRIHKIVGIIIILSVLVGAFYLVVILLYKSITTFTLHLPWYIEQLKEIYKDLTQKIIANFSITTADFFLEYDWGKLARSSLIAFSNSITRFAGFSFIIFILILFLFLEYSIFKNKLTEAFPKAKRKIIIVITRITKDVGKYLAVKAFISAVTGILTWILLLIIGLDFAPIWGLMAFFLNFIPVVGSIFVVICISLQSIVQFYPSIGMIFLVASSMTALQMTLGSIIDPKLQGDRLNLSITIIIFSLAFWGWLWGPIGALLAVPITIAIKTICLSIPFFKPLGVMMGTGFQPKKIKIKMKKSCSNKDESNG
ncbi:MAG: AI-2E family transporter [Spirochaetaceae bacterium]|nr:AI-2E family transporter [Spirochaetaceae bacterium]